MILITGFGAFGRVFHNPAGAVAQLAHGRCFLGEVFVGLVLPVAYRRAHRILAQRAAVLAPRAIVGFGVAQGRQSVTVEQRAARQCGGSPDIDGRSGGDLGDGPRVLSATLPLGWTDPLGAVPSLDAGDYVCNAWLYQALRAWPGLPVGFVHLPLAGVAQGALENAFVQLVARL